MNLPELEKAVDVTHDYAGKQLREAVTAFYELFGERLPCRDPQVEADKPDHQSRLCLLYTKAKEANCRISESIEDLHVLRDRLEGKVIGSEPLRYATIAGEGWPKSATVGTGVRK